MTIMAATNKTQAFPLLYYLAVIAGISLYLWNLAFVEAADSATLEPDGEYLRRTVRIINNSGRHVELYWITSDSGDSPDGESNAVGKFMNTIWNGDTGIKLESFVGDVFEIRERKANTPSPAAVTETEQESFCEHEEPSCQQEQQRKVVATFTVQEDEVTEQIFHIQPSFDLDYTSVYDQEEGELDGAEEELNGEEGESNGEEEELKGEDTEVKGDEEESSGEEEEYTEEEEEEEETFLESEQIYEGDFTYVRVPTLRILNPLPLPVPRSQCTDQAKAALDRLQLQTPTNSSIIETKLASSTLTDYALCVEANLTQELQQKFDESDFQFEALEQGLAFEYDDYTCADFDLPTSSPLRNETWSNKEQLYQVGILHERPRSQIHIIPDFITEEECRAFEEASLDDLHVAVVADGKGGSEYTADRKAMQAGISVPWDKENEGHPIASLSRRVFDYVNHVTGLGIQVNGQEEIMSIQYTGRGTNDTEPDRYKPHCDGECDGRPLQLGGRFATMVMYCTIPKKGGATNFPYAGVHVVPKLGAATFFSYIGFDDLINDKGFTTHSGCPVYEGEKKIVTQWVRYGVDDKHPWDSYDLLV